MKLNCIFKHNKIMLSVLIPTYNYDVSKLIATVHSQLINSAIVFEIIVFEDGSTLEINSSNNLSNTSIIKNTQNIGRVKARQFLALQSKYNWLLFLDADVTPNSPSFISNYLKAIILKYDAYFGGFIYSINEPRHDFQLRWKYGLKKEQVKASIRNKNPYKVIISANYLIKKSIFNTINSKIKDTKGYGFDNYFGALLKQHNTKVLHLDNEVLHLGIEKSDQYVKKTEQAALTLLHFCKSEDFSSHSNELLSFFMFLKRNNFIGIFSKFHFTFKKIMQKNLIGKKPSITILQLYKISFMCQAYKNKTTV